MRKGTPYGILGFLAASALAPIAALSLGGSAALGAVLDQLGGMGGGYLAQVMMDTAARLRREPGRSGDPSAEEWREALAEALTRCCWHPMSRPGGCGRR